MNKQVEIFTDGSCLGNPGRGGYGIVMRYKEHEKQIAKGFIMTTNNRMEMMAAIMALESLKRPVKAVLSTDSSYLKNGITKWLPGWKAKNWRTADNKPVKNVDLWQRLEKAIERHEVKWKWVKGHAGHAENERVDALARQGVKKFR